MSAYDEDPLTQHIEARRQALRQSAVDEAREALLMWLYNEIDVVAEGAWTDTFERRLDALIAAVRAETEEQRTGLVAGSQEAVADLTRRYPLTIAAVRAETLDVDRLERLIDRAHVMAGDDTNERVALVAARPLLIAALERKP